MIIVPPSYEILSDMDSMPLVERIEACGRICYKSEDRITEESAIPFVRNMVAHGHNSVMEMAAITFDIVCGQDAIDLLLASQPKYLIVTPQEAGMLVTGTVRAYREYYKFNPDNAVAQNFIRFLLEDEPNLYFDFEESVAGSEPLVSMEMKRLSLDEVDALPAELVAQHRYLGVRFVTTRAVTHELVRHRPVSYLQESQRYCRYSNDKFGNQVSFIKPMFFEEGSGEYLLWKDAMEKTEAIYLELLKTSTPQAARTVLPNSCKTEIITFCTLAEWKHIFSQRTTAHAEPSMREVMIPLQDEMVEKYPSIFN